MLDAAIPTSRGLTTPPFLYLRFYPYVLPRSPGERTACEATHGRQGGRTLEIQCLIGRSMRTAADPSVLGERTITLDCDVIQADGGTRTAAVSGAWVALRDAVRGLLERGILEATR